MKQTEYFEMNRIGWDQRARVHLNSEFYDVAGFLAGNSSLREIELAELTQVEGKQLLHLQCHFGLDTLSWARLGAISTGMDISPVAIDQAQQLSEKSGVAAEFICSDLYSFTYSQPEAFDIVYTSYGAICWLPELSRWAAIIAANLKPGGTFYMVEFHPIYDLIAGYAYFTEATPDIEESASYTENGQQAITTLATWAHPIASVINALIGAGLQIEQLNEYPFSPYNCFDGLEQRQPGRYYLQHQQQDVPLIYSLKCRKPR